MNMSDSLTSDDFSRVALEKLLRITLSLVKGMSVVIFFPSAVNIERLSQTPSVIC